MKLFKHLILCFVLLASSVTGMGCNTIASTLGFTPPVHKLTASAEQMRLAAVNPAPLPKELDKAVLAAYVIEPGDTLAVEAIDLDSPIRLPGNQPVLPDGTIDLGKYGRPVVAWKTVSQIESEVRRLIDAQVKEAKDAKEKASTAVTVRLIGRESKVFYVLGEANAPRAYPLAGRETVLDGILVAGGLTRQADAKKIIVSRPTKPDGCRILLPICYNEIVQLGDTATNYQLQPGDRIFIPSISPFDGLFRSNTNCGPCLNFQAACGVVGNCGLPAVPTSAPVPLPSVQP